MIRRCSSPASQAAPTKHRTSVRCSQRVIRSVSAVEWRRKTNIVAYVEVLRAAGSVPIHVSHGRRRPFTNARTRDLSDAKRLPAPCDGLWSKGLMDLANVEWNNNSSTRRIEVLVIGTDPFLGYGLMRIRWETTSTTGRCRPEQDGSQIFITSLSFGSINVSVSTRTACRSKDIPTLEGVSPERDARFRRRRTKTRYCRAQ